MPKERHVDALLKKLVMTIEASLAATDAARDAVIDGSAIALAAGVPLADAKDAYDALWLSLLEVTQKS